MIPSPPKRLILPDVPRYIRTHYGTDVTVMTVFNWANKGRNGTKLKTVKADVVNPSGGPHARRVTFTNWVDEFVRETTTFA